MKLLRYEDSSSPCEFHETTLKVQKSFNVMNRRIYFLLLSSLLLNGCNIRGWEMWKFSDLRLFIWVFTLNLEGLKFRARSKENILSPSCVWAVKLFYKVALHQSHDKLHSKVFLNSSERFNWDYSVCCLFINALNANADKLDKHQKIYICKRNFMGEELGSQMNVNEWSMVKP